MVFRDADPRRQRADAEFSAKRGGVLAKHNYTCQGCRYTSRESMHLDVHHVDDNHHNNDDANLVPACHTCHPYQHIGELVRRTDIGGEGLGKVTLVASIPEIDSVNLNLLQRALGVALLDPAEEPVARQIIEHLGERANWVKAEFGSYRPADFAACFSRLSDVEYVNRVSVIDDLRVLFNVETLKKIGREMALDCPALPVAVWGDVVVGIQQQAAAS